MAGRGVYARDERHEFGSPRGIVAPILGNEGINDLPADQPLLHQRSHRVDHLEARPRRQRPGASQRRIPAHRIAGDGDDVDAVAVDRQEVAERAGVDQRRCVVAARVPRNRIGRGSIEREQSLLAPRAALGVKAREHIDLVGMITA